MSAQAAPVIAPIVLQHIEETVFLRMVRGTLVRAPHVDLFSLMRADKRLVAHIDGISVAGPDGAAMLEQVLETPSAGGVFAVAVQALQARQSDLLKRIVDLAAAQPKAARGWVSALGWVSAEDLQGTVRALLGSQVPLHRAWGLAACAMHRLDPGALLAQAVADADPAARVRAWRVAGQMARRDLAEAARQTLMAKVPGEVRRAAAWALALWGEGQSDLVRQTLLAPDPGQDLPCAETHRLAILASPLDWGRDQVRALAAKAQQGGLPLPDQRRMLRLAGWVGDPQVVPWLLHHMAHEPRLARLAGEVFCLITGADIDKQGLFGPPPDGSPTGPTDTPEDDDVALDEDEGLMWPDAAKVQAWWQANASRFAPGQRHFMGQPPGAAHALHVLRHGTQRQRMMAAEHLCLTRPGIRLFPTAAPAWRQQRWLAEEENALGLSATSTSAAS